MDPQVSGSFIPKRPLVETRRSGGGMGLFLLLSILLFVVSLLAAAGVFAYEKILTASIASRAEQLERAEGAFEPKVIEDLSRLDGRLIKTRELLGRHAAPSGVFAFLSTVTLEQVQFTKFSYRSEASGGATISLTGVADSFSTVALQSDQFGAARLLKSVVFSDVAVAATGRVAFNVEAALDPSLYMYTRQDSSAGAVPASSTPAEPPAESPAEPTQQP